MSKILLTLLLFISIMIIFFLKESNAGPHPIWVETIAREAASEPLEAQALVGKVIRVRAKERRKSFKDIVLEPYQFSCWNDGIREWQKPRTQSEIDTALKAWDMSAGRQEKVNLYHDISCSPYWSTAENVEFVKRVGRIKFYYENR